MTTGTPLQLAFARRKRAEEWSRLATLIGTPHDFGNIAAGGSSAGNLAVPASVRLAAAVDGALSVSDVTINVGTRAHDNPATGAADVVWSAGVAWRNELMTVDRAVGSPAGTLTIYAVNDFGERSAIATGTFT